MYELRLMKPEEVRQVYEFLSKPEVYAPDELSEELLLSSEVYVQTYYHSIVGVIWILGDEIKAIYIHPAFMEDIEPGMLDIAKEKHKLLYGLIPARNKGAWECAKRNGLLVVSKYIDHARNDNPEYICAWGEYDDYRLVTEVLKLPFR